MCHFRYIIDTFINNVPFIIHTMPKITIIKEKSGQIKYKLNLPKEVMENLAVKKGDSLSLLSVAGEHLTFQLKRV